MVSVKHIYFILMFVACFYINSPDSLIAQQSLNLNDPGLVPPVINTSPIPEFDYDKLDFGMNMGIEKTPSGRFWACWTAGGDDPNSFMLLALSDDKGQSWSKPKVVVNAQDTSLNQKRAIQNGNLWTDPLGHLWFFFDQSMTDFDGRAGVWYTKCENPDDNDPRWTEAKRIWHGTAKSKPIVLENGEWLLPISLLNRSIIDRKPGYYLEAYHELDDLRMAHVFVSDDQGQVWIRRGGIRFPNPSYDEHHLIEMQDGRLWMTARTNNGIWQSFSSDGGSSWTEPTKFLNHVSSRHFVRRLMSGSILLVKHGELDERTEKRSHIRAFISRDNGLTWQGGPLLDERIGVSYPDGFQDTDGTLYITYDFNRRTHGHVYMVQFTEKEVLNGNLKSLNTRSRKLIYQPLGYSKTN